MKEIKFDGNDVIRVIKRIVEYEIQRNAFMDRLRQVVDITLPIELVLDGVDVIADLLGVPPDNTCDFEYQDDGSCPDGMYSRDWVYIGWDGLEGGENVAEEFIEFILKNK